jgi:broad specificity phosphatase PhoE
LEDRDIDRVSSPSVRCVQTVRPLALARKVAVEEVQQLAEGTPARDATSCCAPPVAA